MPLAASHRIEHDGFCVWKYNGPRKKARGFWHSDHPIDQPLWAYALRSKDGTFWETSRAKGGFVDEAAAVTAALAAAMARAQASNNGGTTAISKVLPSPKRPQ